LEDQKVIHKLKKSIEISSSTEIAAALSVSSKKHFFNQVIHGYEGLMQNLGARI
jgi:hypothetical protein